MGSLPRGPRSPLVKHGGPSPTSDKDAGPGPPSGTFVALCWESPDHLARAQAGGETRLGISARRPGAEVTCDEVPAKGLPPGRAPSPRPVVFGRQKTRSPSPECAFAGGDMPGPGRYFGTVAGAGAAAGKGARPNAKPYPRGWRTRRYREASIRVADRGSSRRTGARGASLTDQQGMSGTHRLA